MKRIIFLVFLIITLQNLFASDFTLQKINDFYKSDFYTVITREDNIFYAVGSRAFHILETDSEGHLQLIQDLPLYGRLFGIEKCHNYIYISAEDFQKQIVYRINVENNNPVVTDSLLFHNCYHNEVFVINNYIFIQVSGLNFYYLYIYDNETFNLLTQYNISANFPFSNFYKLKNNYIYGIGYDVIYIYDVSDIYNFQEVAQVDLSQYNTELEFGKLLNDSTYVFCGPHQFTFWDISDITNWNLLSRIEFESSNKALRNFAKLNNDRIVISRNFTQDLYDLSDISNPVLLDTLYYTFFLSLSSLGYGDNFYVPNANLGIEEFKVENDQIIRIGRYPKFAALCNAFKHQDKLIVPTIYHLGVHFFDISDIYNPQYICTHFENYHTYGIDFHNNLMAISISSPPFSSNPHYSIEVYDISDVANPILVNQLRDKSSELIYLVDNALYTIEYQSDNLWHFIKYDITYPGIPGIIFDFILPDELYGFSIYNNYAYFRGENSIYVIKDISNNNPQIVNNVYVGEGFAMRIEDNYLLLFYFDENKVKFYNLENPEFPICEYEIIFEIPSFGLGLHNDLLFAGSFNINVYDLNNCSYYIQDPIYTFHNSYMLKSMIFFEENNKEYFYCVEQTSVILYEYSYGDTTSVNDGLAYKNNICLYNYPNPFNPKTIITFSVPKGISESASEIRIYNIKGEMVKKLEIQNDKSSIQKVIWNGKDDNNKPVSSGIYLYQLKCGEYKSPVKKMCLIK